MLRRTVLYLLFLYTTCLGCVQVSAATLASYSDGAQTIDVCRADLTRDRIRTYWRDETGTALGSLENLRARLAAHGEKLACASNAGIFGKDLTPIGLYVEASNLLHRLNTRKGAYGNFYLQPNGAFLLTGSQALIMSTDALAANLGTVLPTVRYATQSGPLLLTNGQINPQFTPGSDNRLIRNAVCVLSPTEIALVRSRQPINFYDFARLIRDKLGARDALYLDGTVSRLFPYDTDALADSVGPLIGVVSGLR